MTEKILVPVLGESITEATVSKWLKSKGDNINADEPIVELETDKVNLEVTSNINKIKSSDKIVLPGQGSFKSCVDSLNSINGLVETLKEFAITNKKPLLGICVGLQMFADIGYEEVVHNLRKELGGLFVVGMIKEKRFCCIPECLNEILPRTNADEITGSRCNDQTELDHQR